VRVVRKSSIGFGQTKVPGERLERRRLFSSVVLGVLVVSSHIGAAQTTARDAQIIARTLNFSDAGPAGMPEIGIAGLVVACLLASHVVIAQGIDHGSFEQLSGEPITITITVTGSAQRAEKGTTMIAFLYSLSDLSGAVLFSAVAAAAFAAAPLVHARLFGDVSGVSSEIARTTMTAITGFTGAVLAFHSFRRRATYASSRRPLPPRPCNSIRSTGSWPTMVIRGLRQSVRRCAPMPNRSSPMSGRGFRKEATARLPLNCSMPFTEDACD
jgi:hypothetical protein